MHASWRQWLGFVAFGAVLLGAIAFGLVRIAMTLLACGCTTAP